MGHIQRAHLGTLFLDELSELAYPLQAKLLRLLQSGEFHRLGSSELHHAEIRVVAATSKDLKPLVESGAFQKALYYRLSVVPIRVPTLRERPGDIPLLAKHFVSKYAPRNQKVLQIEQAVMDTLQAYPFPGNVRELENLIHRLVVLAEGSSIKLEDVPMGVLQVNSHRINLAKDPLYRILTTPPRDLVAVRLKQRIEAVCGAAARDVQVTLRTATNLQIRFTARSDKEGEQLSTRIFQLSELGPYEVSMEVQSLL